jgi:hypothetical protein
MQGRGFINELKERSRPTDMRQERLALDQAQFLYEVNR